MRTSTTFNALPAVGTAMECGTFAGLITLPDGTHNAVVLLAAQGSNMGWKKAGEWAEQQGGVLPTRPIAALLYANVKDQLRPEWHWTSESAGASYAWICYFLSGIQGLTRKSFEGSAVAVRLIPLSA